jgi:hypothetical protein
MTTPLAVLAAAGAYFLTMAILLAVLGFLRFNVQAFGILNVQPYRSAVKWATIGASVYAGYVAFSWAL